MWWYSADREGGKRHYLGRGHVWEGWQCLPTMSCLIFASSACRDVVFNQITCESCSFFYSFIEVGWLELGWAGLGEEPQMSSFGMSGFSEMWTRQDWVNRSWQWQPPIVLGCETTSRLFHSSLVRDMTVRRVMWGWETGARSGAFERNLDQVWLYA